MDQTTPQPAPKHELISPDDEREIQRWLTIHPGRTERIVRVLTTWFWDVFFRLKTYGQPNIPATGAFLFCPNHSSWFDPFLQARGQTRLIRFMGKAEVFEWPLVKHFVKAGGSFPVRRGQGDAFAMVLARRILEDGQPLCIFPEGTRYRKDDELGPSRRGAARLALQTRVPVIPVATHGAKPRKARGARGPAWKLPRITTVYGPPMNFDQYEDTKQNVDIVRDEIWAEVQRLYEIARELNGRRLRPRRFAVPPRPSDS